MSTVETRTSSPEQTRAVAAALAEVVTDGDLLVLTGDLGAGKTCFTQGLGAGLGIDDRLTSPTFTLANRYQGRVVLNHLDVYRLDGPDDAMDLDLIGLLEDGVTVIEWGDRIDELLPEDRLRVLLRFPEIDAGDGLGHHGGDDARLIRFEGWPERDLERLLDRWVVTS